MWQQQIAALKRVSQASSRQEGTQSKEHSANEEGAEKSKSQLIYPLLP